MKVVEFLKLVRLDPQVKSMIPENSLPLIGIALVSSFLFQSLFAFNRPNIKNLNYTSTLESLLENEIVSEENPIPLICFSPNDMITKNSSSLNSSSNPLSSASPHSFSTASSNKRDQRLVNAFGDSDMIRNNTQPVDDDD